MLDRIHKTIFPIYILLVSSNSFAEFDKSQVTEACQDKIIEFLKKQNTKFIKINDRESDSSNIFRSLSEYLYIETKKIQTNFIEMAEIQEQIESYSEIKGHAQKSRNELSDSYSKIKDASHEIEDNVSPEILKKLKEFKKMAHKRIVETKKKAHQVEKKSSNTIRDKKAELLQIATEIEYRRDSTFQVAARVLNQELKNQLSGETKKCVETISQIKTAGYLGSATARKALLEKQNNELNIGKKSLREANINGDILNILEAARRRTVEKIISTVLRVGPALNMNPPLPLGSAKVSDRKQKESNLGAVPSGNDSGGSGSGAGSAR